MGAQGNSYRLVNSDEISDVVEASEVRSMIARIALEHSKGMYAYRPATYMNTVINAFRKQNALKINKDEPLNECKLATLYLIDKAYDQFVALVELLKKMGEYRFELKRFAKDLEQVFSRYHRLRDKNSFIDPLLFSDIMDVYEEKYGEQVDEIRSIINDSLNDEQSLSDDWRDVISFVLLIYGFILCAEFNRDYITNHLSLSYVISFKIFDFIDFPSAKTVLRRSVLILNKRKRLDIQFSDEAADGFRQLGRNLLLDKEIVEQVNFLQHE